MLATKINPITKHVFKLEELSIPLIQANKIESTFKEFLLDLGFKPERIEALECRSRDGFSPFSYNKGGLSAVTFAEQRSIYNDGTGFKNTDKILEQYYSQDYKDALEQYLEKTGITEKYFHSMPEDDKNEFIEYFDSYRDESDDTVLFGLDVMMTSENSLSLRFTVCAKDSPYHRSYDDLIEIKLKFKNITELKVKLKKVLLKPKVITFQDNLKSDHCF